MKTKHSVLLNVLSDSIQIQLHARVATATAKAVMDLHSINVSLATLTLSLMRVNAFINAQMASMSTNLDIAIGVIQAAMNAGGLPCKTVSLADLDSIFLITNALKMNVLMPHILPTSMKGSVTGVNSDAVTAALLNFVDSAFLDIIFIGDGATKTALEILSKTLSGLSSWEIS